MRSHDGCQCVGEKGRVLFVDGHLKQSAKAAKSNHARLARVKNFG